MRKLILTISLLAVCLVGPLWAESHDLVGNNQNQTYTMQAGDNLSVLGNSNTILVLGAAGGVSVVGNNNQITVDAEVPRVDVMGNNNMIFLVDRPGRPSPSVGNLGHDNKVEHLVPKP